MPSVVVDSNILYALFDASDRSHSLAKAFISTSGGRLVSNVPVLTEVAYMLEHSKRSQLRFLQFADRALAIDMETPVDLPRIIEIMDKYADLPADFADAALLAQCERTGIDRIATLDSDFEVYRMANGRPLVNVIART